MTLFTNSAETAPDSADERLRGRTYAVPFDQVWRAAVRLAGGGLRGWRLVEEDDYEGRIRAEATTLVWRLVDDVEITIRLDENGQTRVDMRSASRKGWSDLGTNRRRIGRFFRKLDQTLTRSRRATH